MVIRTNFNNNKKRRALWCEGEKLLFFYVFWRFFLIFFFSSPPFWIFIDQTRMRRAQGKRDADQVWIRKGQETEETILIAKLIDKKGEGNQFAFVPLVMMSLGSHNQCFYWGLLGWWCWSSNTHPWRRRRVVSADRQPCDLLIARSNGYLSQWLLYLFVRLIWATTATASQPSSWPGLMCRVLWTDRTEGKVQITAMRSGWKEPFAHV